MASRSLLSNTDNCIMLYKRNGTEGNGTKLVDRYLILPNLCCPPEPSSLSPFYSADLFFLLDFLYFVWCHAVSVCLPVVRFGHWVCGESWRAIKDSLTHCPSSQGWAPGVLPLCVCVCVCVLWFWYLVCVGGFLVELAASMVFSCTGVTFSVTDILVQDYILKDSSLRYTQQCN